MLSRAKTLTPRFRVISVELRERAVRFRMPFRFGATTLEGCPQAFVRAAIELADGRRAHGVAAEMMVPKWFDKSAEKSNADNVDDLRDSLRCASDVYLAAHVPRSAFAHFAEHYEPLLRAGALRAQESLVINYGAAVLDRALLDALCRALNVSFATAVLANVPGIDASITPDLEGTDIDAFLAALEPRQKNIAARHTVGLVDPLTADEIIRCAQYGLPQSLDQVITRYGNTHFKLKLSGDADADIARLGRIAAVLDGLPEYVVTLDGNEQYADTEALVGLIDALRSTSRLARLAECTRFIEQPFARSVALNVDVGAAARWWPLLIDESDATVDAFVQARTRGYDGVSSKSCKGVYKSLLNAARCARWNASAGQRRYFVSGEDLTMQPGLGMQQDLALVSLLQLPDVERNGHHYVDGFGGGGADDREQENFLAAYPSLYERSHGGVRLAIRGGMIDLASMAASGFASLAEPDFSALDPLGTGDACMNARSPAHRTQENLA